MAKGKTHEFKGTTYSEIPEEIAEKLGIEPGQDINFLNPYKDLVILIPGKKGNSNEEEDELTKDELKVLKKIGKIRHWKRTRNNLHVLLQEEEEKTMKKLINKGVLFEYTKEGEKRIGIDREYFPLVTGKENSIDKLENKGYAVVEEEREAKELQKEIKEKGIENKVRGIRGFDRKYYVIKKDKLEQLKDKIVKELGEEKIVQDISEDLGIEEELCKTALTLMREDGEIVEKKKDVYTKS